MQASGFRGLSILVLDDEPLLRRQLTGYLESLGMDVTGAGDLAAARKLAKGMGFDFALLDVNLPDGKGTDLLREKVFPPSTGVIVMTAEGGVAGAVEAMKLGALDYLVKPFDPGELPLVIGRARRARQTARLDEFRQEDAAQPDFLFGAALAGVEQQLQRIIAADERVQTGLAPVLILGETGSGKTSIARWLHQHGPRAAQPLVEVNCSALPESLAESELFGHERGAFTDARTARMGLFEAAHEGTLFLDELPSLSLALQAKVLTAIEDRRIRRLGGNKTIEVDVRVIAATNRDLEELVASGQFREDLYHRLDLFRIHLPPLRERGEDIVRIAELLLARLCRRHRLPPRRITAAGRQRLLTYPWPGNVRELAHELERAIVFSDAVELDFATLDVRAGRTPPGGAGLPSEEWFNEAFVFPEQGFSLDAAIERLMRQALRQAGGNVSAAARLLGVSRDVVRYRLEGRKGVPDRPE
ncbi:MAG: sigma-54-dependent Fis family transcriptional regulator [Verrucomicrobia bacterium]|nr:sigma-54-dependent Fis family transcriptional regulator [Verrucomicrobiota bacterium]